MRSEVYVCPTCGATKTLYADPSESTREFEEDLPEKIFCGVNDCSDYAVP